MRILDSKEYESIFSWNKAGNAIIIHKPYELVSEVLTNHFGAKDDMKYDSFLRKLYRWGFSKLIVGGKSAEGDNLYIHEVSIDDGVVFFVTHLSTQNISSKEFFVP